MDLFDNQVFYVFIHSSFMPIFIPTLLCKIHFQKAYFKQQVFFTAYSCTFFPSFIFYFNKNTQHMFFIVLRDFPFTTNDLLMIGPRSQKLVFISKCILCQFILFCREKNFPARSQTFSSRLGRRALGAQLLVCSKLINVRQINQNLIARSAFYSVQASKHQQCTSQTLLQDSNSKHFHKLIFNSFHNEARRYD